VALELTRGSRRLRKLLVDRAHFGTKTFRRHGKASQRISHNQGAGGHFLPGRREKGGENKMKFHVGRGKRGSSKGKDIFQKKPRSRRQVENQTPTLKKKYLKKNS